MKNYAMVCNNCVTDILLNQEVKPEWPPVSTGDPMIAVPCDDTVKPGMEYNHETGGFSYPVPVEPEEPEETLKEPSQLDRIEEKLNVLTADNVTAESINTAILEGVNEV